MRRASPPPRRGEGIAQNVGELLKDIFAIDPQPDVSGSSPTAPLQVYDPDGDGDPDIAVAPGQILRNDGPGNLAPAARHLPDPPSGTWWGGEGYRGDFDGDGDVDLIVAHFQGPVTQDSLFLGMRVLLNAGGGGFTAGGYALPPGKAFRYPRPSGAGVVQSNGLGLRFR